MTVEAEVALLTTAVDNVTAAVNVSKATLDASVASSLGYANTSNTHKTGSETAKTGAEAARDLALTYSQNAASAVAYQDLTAIAQAKAVTAVDVFVYDTSKDSDGGAWRKRTQATSWYNEALNTATRGSRKEFPAVAVIVAESNKVTIYDGDDPTMPMWMVFNAASSGLLLQSSGAVSSLAILNGVLSIGQSGHGLFIVGFTSEITLRYISSTDLRKYDGSIATRNDTIGWSDYSYSGFIVNSSVNDVAMTVLPNAPIDSATGLPIPTIAVATDGGVSVIKDDGSVVDITWSNGSNSSLVSFIDNKVFVVHDFSGAVARYGHLFNIPTTDLAEGTYYAKGSAGEFYGPSGFKLAPSTASYVNISHQAGSGFGFAGYSAKYSGLTVLERNLSNYTTSAVAYITSDYNTGYMVGDIKLAALSDTDDTDVVGTELVTNGTFDSDVSGWVDPADSRSTSSFVSNKLRITNAGSGGGYGFVTQAIATVVGKAYTFTTETLTVGTAYSRRIFTGTSVGSSNLGASTANSDYVHTVTFIATGVTTYIAVQLFTTSLSAECDFDNISVHLADTDRSVNANGLAVHGTITKSAVATGADLVAYSGFSASNYLEQPYNSDLDFGTGDFSVMGWVSLTGDGSTDYIFERDNAASAGVKTFISLINGVVNFNVGSVNLATASVVADDVLTFIVCVRVAGVAYTYVNGILSNSIANTQSNTNATAILRLGSRTNGGQPLPVAAALALWRISATAPSAAQIKKIYEAEKPLFQENAQATLYGTSDAVTALAHDSDTDLLHVGTSSGRSVFQGLRRVDNTTTAVGAAISAANGLVVEE
tara:strand:- start:5302 stop:7770 length:2469 start_codon:yes stop_codon:yes gene_type:complete